MKYFFTLFILTILINSAIGQSACGIAGDDPPGCLMCSPTFVGSNEGYTAGVPGPTFPCGTIENNLWISVIAANTSAQFAFFVGDCQNDQGLTILVYDQSLNPVSTCLSNGAIGPNQAGSISFSQITPGEIYWVMIDGLAGDVC
ncbi:MAG: hypothetical protein R2769_06195, partial [Saprospiraceae bacterium]